MVKFSVTPPKAASLIEKETFKDYCHQGTKAQRKNMNLIGVP
jgi:hypothetical protein